MTANVVELKSPPELYAPIHRGIRSRCFRISVAAGMIESADQASIEAFQVELTSWVANIRLHHSLETKFIHPLLASRVAGGARKLEDEHKEVDRRLDDLLVHFDAVRARVDDMAIRRKLAHEFYLAFNRLIAFFLQHIDDEEEHVQLTLWNLCTFRELATTWGTLVGSQTPEQAAENLGMIFSSSSQDDNASLLAMIEANAPPAMFQNILKVAERTLEAGSWSALKARIGTT